MYFLRSDYQSASTKTDATLSEIKSQLSSLSSLISHYCTNANNVLSGEAYSTILNRLDLYSEACKFLGNAVDVTLNNMTAGNNSTMNAMGSYSELSGENLQEIENEISRQRSLYNSIVSQTESTSDSDTEDTTKSTSNSGDTYYAKIKELEAEKTKIEDALINTNSADNSGAGNLTDISSIISNLGDCFV